jgi:hypothetical protein
MKFDINAGWDITGKNVTGSYMGIPVTGRVIDSRVKFGGVVQYRVALDAPLALPWVSLNNQPMEECNLNAEDVSDVE